MKVGRCDLHGADNCGVCFWIPKAAKPPDPLPAPMNEHDGLNPTQEGEFATKAWMIPEAMKSVLDRIKVLEVNRINVKLYAAMKLDEDDFHAVEDAASDLRDIDAELRGLRLGLG